jgi:hypothetical protein
MLEMEEGREGGGRETDLWSHDEVLHSLHDVLVARDDQLREHVTHGAGRGRVATQLLRSRVGSHLGVRPKKINKINQYIYKPNNDDCRNLRNPMSI